MNTIKKPKKPNLNLPYKQEVDDICIKLRAENTMSEYDHNMITGIQNFCARTGRITSKQLSQVGRCSRKYLQNGKYVQHGWWQA